MLSSAPRLDLEFIPAIFTWYVILPLLADCSVCSKNYVRGLRFSCRECSDRTVSMAIAIVLAVLALACGLGIIFYLVYIEEGDTEQGIVDRIKRRVPMQPLKIIIVLWQIITQVSGQNANLEFR